MSSLLSDDKTEVFIGVLPGGSSSHIETSISV